jgi:hypothetical protein
VELVATEPRRGAVEHFSVQRRWSTRCPGGGPLSGWGIEHESNPDEGLEPAHPRGAGG